MQPLGQNVLGSMYYNNNKNIIAYNKLWIYYKRHNISKTTQQILIVLNVPPPPKASINGVHIYSPSDWCYHSFVQLCVQYISKVYWIQKGYVQDNMNFLIPPPPPPYFLRRTKGNKKIDISVFIIT